MPHFFFGGNMPRTHLRGLQVADDTITGADVKEETLVDSKIPFSDPNFAADNVHNAIIEAKNNSIVPCIINTNESIIIAENHQMVIYCGLEIYGNLTIYGSLVMR